MPNSARLTPSTIKRYIPDPYFERGQNYYSNGAITEPVCRANELFAYCEGSDSQPYRVQVTLDNNKIAGDDCSCPMGGGCKHVVALLLTWAHHPEQFEEREPVDAALERKSKAELVALVGEMLKRAPELERLMDLPAPGKGQKRRTAINPDTYRKQIRYAMRAGDDWRAVSGIAQEISSIVDIGDGFAAQEDWENAARVYQAVLDEGLDGYEMTQDEGDIAGELDRAVEGLGACLAAQIDDDTARRSLLRALFDVVKWDIESGGLGVGDMADSLLLQYASTVDCIEIRKWIQAALKTLPAASDFSRKWRVDNWGRLLLAVDEKSGDIEGFIKRATAQGLHQPLFTKLLELERFDEALAVARKHLGNSAWERIGIADQLEAANRNAEALAFAEAGLPNNDDARLFEWLGERYAKQKQPARAIAMYQQSWSKRPSLELYDQLHKLSKRLDQWNVLRPSLLAQLEQSNHWDVLVQVLVRDQAWDAAWEVVEKARRQTHGIWDGFPDSHLALIVAAASEKHRPTQAAQAYLTHAEALIRQQGRDNYKAAANFLLKARKLYQQLKQTEEWESHLAGLRDMHRNKRAFQEELNKAKL